MALEKFSYGHLRMKGWCSLPARCLFSVQVGSRMVCKVNARCTFSGGNLLFVGFSALVCDAVRCIPELEVLCVG